MLKSVSDAVIILTVALSCIFVPGKGWGVPEPVAPELPGCETNIDEDIPDWIRDHFRCAEIWSSRKYYFIRTRGIPDHRSFYFGPSHPGFEPLPDGKIPNPNRIQSQDFLFRIPVIPVENSFLTESSLGPVGVAINGVPIFNNQARPGDTLAREIRTFDTGNGHPTETGSYHYHVEPLKLTSTDSRLIGVLRDGFPVYGKLDETGEMPDDLDATNGHKHPTSHFPGGIYHYHVTGHDPYISSAYRGNPGPLSQ